MTHHLTFWLIVGAAALVAAIIGFATGRITPRAAYIAGRARGRQLQRQESADRMRRAMTVEVPSVVPRAQSPGVWS